MLIIRIRFPNGRAALRVHAVTSLVIVGFVVKEVREAWSGEDCCDHG
jgi:hypothetical protein